MSIEIEITVEVSIYCDVQGCHEKFPYSDAGDETDVVNDAVDEAQNNGWIIGMNRRDPGKHYCPEHAGWTD